MAGADETARARGPTEELDLPKPVSTGAAADPAAAQDPNDRAWARLRYHDDDLLTVAQAARLSGRSVRTGLVVGHPKSRASRRTISLPAGLRPMLEQLLASPGVRTREGYAVARAIDENSAELAYSDDPADPDRLLFVTSTGRPVRHNLFYKRIFQPAVAAALPARLRRLRFHDLRHTCAALSLAANPNLTLVKERLGHENIATTIDLYGKRVPSVDAAVADAVGAFIFTADERTARSRTAGRIG